jgi:hypothetical protein
MEGDILKAVREYKERHPEVDEIMRKFQMTQEVYERALASIGVKVPQTGPTYSLTTGGRYNANVSTSN